MTAQPATRSRTITSTRLYAAAIFGIGMAVPHLAIGLAGHWPGQLMSAHVLLIVLLLLAALRVELTAERREVPAAASNEFDDIADQLRNLDR